jgi:hypothetical protein
LRSGATQGFHFVLPERQWLGLRAGVESRGNLLDSLPIEVWLGIPSFANRDKVHLDVGSAGPFHKPPGEGDSATGLPVSP